MHDTRAAGGAIIAAGSVRRVARTLRSYRVVNNTALILLPSWLITALTTSPISQAQAPILLTSTRQLGAYTQAALEGETTAVAQAVPGTRAHTLFRSAARLGELVGAGALDETVAFQALLAAAPISTSGADQFRAMTVPSSARSPLTGPQDSPKLSPAAK